MLLRVVALVLVVNVLGALAQTNVSVGCFSGETLVESKNHGMVRINELSPGDYIKTYDHSSQQHVFSKFIDYLHYEPERVENYVALKTDSNVDLEISEYHLIQRVAGSSYEYVFAKDLKQDDQIYVSAEQGIQIAKIAVLESIVKQGAYAPLTEHGTLLANNVLASCYAHVISHELAQWFFLPIRVWDIYVNNNNEQISSIDKDTTYMSSYLEYLLELMRYPPFSLVFHN